MSANMDRVLRSARRVRAAYRELRDGDGRGAGVCVSLELEGLDAALEAHDDAETMAQLRDGRCIDVETTEVGS